MKIKELIKELQLIDENADIYIQNELELYEPIIQSIYDTDTENDYYILTIK